ncbi:hypothetical protein F5Y19DRAFT_489069 [Xylariaceae sp. FL1651]|nr:hypothetical protein F5Y19DRAFT_489069 [Xylariaceae sp. FL1651]
MPPSKPSQPIFLFTHPRTASNLLLQMLRTHPEIDTIEYPFNDTYYFGQDSLTLRRNVHIEAAKQRLQANPALAQTFQIAFDQLEQSIQRAQAMKKIPFIKEHAFTIMKPDTISQNLAYPCPCMNTPQIRARTAKGHDVIATEADDDDDSSNPTVLPTRFLRSVTPVFLIRHPALVFESVLRVSGPTMGARIDDEEFPVEASLRWLRILYDWYPVRPIVLNADEIMAHPTTVQKLCEQLQLDPTGVRFKWDPVPPSIIEGQSSYQRHFFSTIQSSSGVQLDKRSAAQGQELDLDAMTATWQDIYGLETAAALRSFVDAAMPDYEYLCRYELKI